MKLKKLNSRGFTHGTILVLFVVIFAIAGVGYLVASHAADCDNSVSGSVSDPTSGVTSSPVTPQDCTPASAAVTAPVTATVTTKSTGATTTTTTTSTTTQTPAVTGQGTCVIGGVASSTSGGTRVTPSVTVKNTGTVAMSPAIISSAAGVPFKEAELSQINPGQSVTVTLGTYTMPTTGGTSVLFYAHSDTTFAGTNKAAFSCSTPSSVRIVTLGSCVIESVPSYIRNGQKIQPIARVHNSGNVSFRPTLTQTTTDGRTTTRKAFLTSTIQPSLYSNVTLSPYQYRKTGGLARYVTFTVTSNTSPSFSCSAKSQLL